MRLWVLWLLTTMVLKVILVRRVWWPVQNTLCAFGICTHDDMDERVAISKDQRELLEMLVETTVDPKAKEIGESWLVATKVED